MRLIHAFTIQRTYKADGVSGILDWLLTPYYIKKAYPNSTLVLYTNMQSAQILGELWSHIKSAYDEVYVDLQKNNKEIFSYPKFEAMSKELWSHGTDFIMLDNDLYIFPGFLETIKSNYCIYYAEPSHYIAWYHSIINNEYACLHAPDWFTWDITPYNCATIRINDKALLLEYLKVYNTVQAENLSESKGHKAMIKEQWSLGELLNKHQITPQSLFNKKYSFHKGCIKPLKKPVELIQLQELLLAKLRPNTFKVFIKLFNHDDYFKSDLSVDNCFKNIDQEYKDGLLAPILEQSK